MDEGNPERPTVDWMAKAILYDASGTPFRRRAGFEGGIRPMASSFRRVQTSGTFRALSDNRKPPRKPKKGK